MQPRIKPLVPRYAVDGTYPALLQLPMPAVQRNDATGLKASAD
jgi:hypothetical protein